MGEPHPKNCPIQQQFCLLQHHWNRYKSSNHNHPSLNNSTLHQDIEAMLDNDNSPRQELISSHHPFSSTWKIRTNELAQQEIRAERRAAIASGKLKGRKLSYDHMDMGLGLGLKLDVFPGNYCDGFLHQSVPSIPFSDSDTENSNGEAKEEVPVCLNGLSYSSASSSTAASSSLSGKEMKEQMAAKEEEQATPTLGEKRQVGIGLNIGKRELGLAWLAIASIIMVIFSVCSLGLGLGAYDEERPPFLLVPT